MFAFDFQLGQRVQMTREAVSEFSAQGEPCLPGVVVGHDTPMNVILVRDDNGRTDSWSAVWWRPE